MSDAHLWISVLKHSKDPLTYLRLGFWLRAAENRRRDFLAACPTHLHASHPLQKLRTGVERLSYELTADEEQNAAHEEQLRRSQKKAFVLASALASVGLLALAAIGYQTWDRGQMYSTGVGGFERLALSDGSVVDLNTDSLIRVRYDESARKIELVRGEAVFKVAADAARPFSVRSDGTTVRALGTEFSVRRFGAERVDVLVDAGRVEVRHGGRAVAVNAGEGASDVDGIVSARPLGPDELALKQSWRNGLVLFKDAELGEVIAEFNRYSYHHVRLRDQALAAKRVAGGLRPAHAESFLEMLMKSMHLRAIAEPGDDGAMILEPDASAP